MMESSFLLMAQSTSIITSMIGILALIFLIKILLHLEEGQFKNIFFSIAVFLFVTLIGVVAMTFYHLYDEVNANIADSAEMIWYNFMFASLFFSIYGSITASKFFEPLKKIGNKLSKKK